MTRPRPGRLAVVLLLIVYWVLAVTGVRGKSVTFDEIAHLTSGVSYWVTNEYGLNPENGNLPQRWAALPLLGACTFPTLDQDAWRTSTVWRLGDQFLYGTGNDADTLLRRGRGMIALFGVALGYLVFAWSRSLFGTAGGMVSLVLFVTCPATLANGSLVTSDMAAALFFTASVGALWRVLHRVSPGTVLGSAVVLAGLFLSKMSGVLIVPVGLLLLAARLRTGRPLPVALPTPRLVGGRPRQCAVFLGVITVQVLIVWMLIWASFGMRYSAFRSEDPRPTFYLGGWSQAMTDSGPVASVIRTARDHRLLPEAYLYGLAFTRRFAKVRSAFLNGRVRNEGWPWFFPYCLLVKTPLALFGLLLLGGVAVAAVRLPRSGFSRAPPGRRWSFYETLPLWTFLMVYWVSAVTSHLNIGHRHLLPTYPALFILAGAAGWWLRKTAPRVLRGAVVLLLVWAAVESVRTWPDYVSYFNAIAGGPRHGYRHLVDSSLDWGQDLPGLQKWLTAHRRNGPGQAPVYLSYFGTGRPEYYGVHATLLPGYFDTRQTVEQPRPWTAGTYCISATMLQGVYLSTPTPWTEAYEGEYQLAEGILPMALPMRDDPAGHAGLIRDAQLLLRRAGVPADVVEGQFWAGFFRLVEQLRFCRLCAFLRQREPDAHVGYSILIYILSDADLEQALRGPAPLHH